MKPGDLVRSCPVNCHNPDNWGIVVDVVQKKCWRAHIQGKNVDWGSVDPEPHAVVLYPGNNGTVTVPTRELEVMI